MGRGAEEANTRTPQAGKVEAKTRGRPPDKALLSVPYGTEGGK